MCPEEKAEAQHKDTLAHSERRAAMRPEEQAEAQQKNTLAHSERRATMCPEEKAEAQHKDTLAHSERRAAMRPEEQAEAQQKNTLAHSERRAAMCPEEKAEFMMKDKVAHRRSIIQCSTGSKQINLLAGAILEHTKVEKDIIKLVRKKYTLHPNLALYYYHCCSTDPIGEVFNDDDTSDEFSEFWDNLYNVIGPPIGEKEASFCQELCDKISCSKNRIAFCASCCEKIVSSFDCQNIIEISVSKLHYNFLLSHKQLSELEYISKDVVEEHVMVYSFNGNMYHLNPDLITDPTNIVLCSNCANDPLNNEFSIANGHDYGRQGSLPKLNATTLNAIIPCRCFNIDIKLMGNHSTGHSIAFPCDGPVETSKILPCHSPDNCPQVTFIGPKEAWRKAKKMYKYLYSLDVEEAYRWLRVWKELKNPFFENVTVDESKNLQRSLRQVTDQIERDAIVTNSRDVIEMATLAQSEDDDVAEIQSDNLSDNSSSPLIIHSAVLPKPSLVEVGMNYAVEALSKIIHPFDEESDESPKQPVVVVSRLSDPIDEWTQNESILGGAFPHLFITGKGIPTKNISINQWKHFSLYYDGRFDDALFIAHGFNQLQRSSCIRKSATISVKQMKQLESLATLANSLAFREKLTWARDNPFSKGAMSLNSKVCKILSMVGSTVPFSPFERSATRSKMCAHRYRYGNATFFITGAPPEFEDDLVLRTCCISKWNDPSCVISKAGFQRKNLPLDITTNTSIRLRITKNRPLLSALCFHQKLDILLRAVVGCPSTKDTRRSNDFDLRNRHSFGKIASVNGVIEPQADGRLHWHINLYGSVISPSLLTRLAMAPERLQRRTSLYLDSIVNTKNSIDIYDWYNGIKGEELELNQKLRAADLLTPDASADPNMFFRVAKQKGMLSGMHAHGFTCQKLPKGRYQCRVSMPRGVYPNETSPIIVKMLSPADHKAATRAQFSIANVDDSKKMQFNRALDLLAGEFRYPHCDGAIIWEQQRFEEDKYYVEQNLITTNLVQCHNNASVISGQDAGEAVEEYLISYFGKEAAPLKQAAAVLLAAIEHIHLYPSKADDKHSLSRTAKHLAQRTINSFSGSHQWSLPLMASALLGNRSHITSDGYRYIFPHDNVTFLNGYNDTSSSATNKEDINSTDYVNSCLDSLITAADSIGTNSGVSGGTTSYKIRKTGEVVFLTQALSYANRGPYFEAYSQMEFECIIELRERGSESSDYVSGRPSRPGFELGAKHPLYESHEGFIRCKMLTPILAGKPPPKFPGNMPSSGSSKLEQWLTDMNYFAKYIIDMMVPWSTDGTRQFQRDVNGFCDMLHSWNSRTAPFICQQRYRYISNIIGKGYRSSQNEKTVSAWRDRNSDRWSELKNVPTSGYSFGTDGEIDTELKGVLSANEIYNITMAVTTPDIRKKIALQTMTNKYDMIFRSADTTLKKKELNIIPSYPIHIQHQYSMHGEKLISIKEMRNLIGKLRPEMLEVIACDDIHRVSGETDCDRKDMSQDTDEILKDLTTEQATVLKKIIGTNQQQLIFMHGGGGTGKTHVTCKLVSIMESRDEFCCCVCPTGVGACYLPGGRTFHSTFKAWQSSLSASHVINDIATDLHGNKLKAVMIDEVSMFTAEFLVLLNDRLRSIYDPMKPFGGISIILSGDFIQLPATGGTDLWAVMYGHVKGELATARELFSRFFVLNMTQQMRAANCADHCRRLTAYRVLPKSYPKGDRWTAADIATFQPINENIVSGLTRELTEEDVLTEPRWLTEATILVTSNIDRANLNSAAARRFGVTECRAVFYWRKSLVKDLSFALQNVLYDEDLRPDLFAYFVEGAPAQILDNGNGNVDYGIANGTACRMVSLAWDDPEKERYILDHLKRNKVTVGLIMLPFPPDYFIVSISPRPNTKWPDHLNLASTSDAIHIPVGLISRVDPKRHSCRLSKGVRVTYHKHAVDLAFAMSIWKAQGGTFQFIIGLLESSPGSLSLTYEGAYVMHSRVRESARFRCFPLSKFFNINCLLKLRPKILATKWRMDIGEDGMWRARETSKYGVQKKTFVPLNSAFSTPLQHNVTIQKKTVIPIPTNLVKPNESVHFNTFIHSSTTCNNQNFQLSKGNSIPTSSVLSIINESGTHLHNPTKSSDTPSNNRVYTNMDDWLLDNHLMVDKRYKFTVGNCLYDTISYTLGDFDGFNLRFTCLSWSMNEIKEGTALGHSMLEAYEIMSASDENLHGTSSLEGYINAMKDIHKYATELDVTLLCNYLHRSVEIYSRTCIQNLANGSQQIRPIIHCGHVFGNPIKVWFSVEAAHYEPIIDISLCNKPPNKSTKRSILHANIKTAVDAVDYIPTSPLFNATMSCCYPSNSEVATSFAFVNEQPSTYKNRVSGSSNITIIQHHPVNIVEGPVTRHIEDCATAWKFIHGDVLNYFFFLMMQSYSNVKIIPTYFYQRLHLEGGNWSLYEHKWVGRQRENHDQFLRQLQDKTITTIIPMGSSNHWTILVKSFIVDKWFMRFADSIGHDNSSSLHYARSLLEGTPVCHNEDPIYWEDVKFQPQTEFECGARTCVAAVILASIGDAEISQSIRKLDQVTNLSGKAREFVTSVCENQAWFVPDWLRYIIN
jgi:hypothetical protein